MSQINLGLSDNEDIANPPQGYAALFSASANKLGIKSSNGTVSYLRGVPNLKLRKKIKLTSEMIIAKEITLEETPEESVGVLLIPVGGPHQIYGLDYIITDNVLSWADLGLDGVLSVDDTLAIYY